MTSREALITEEKDRPGVEGIKADSPCYQDEKDELSSKNQAKKPESSEYREPVSGGGSAQFGDDEDESQSFKTFTESGLAPKILTSVKKMGWQAPTPIQSLCLPYSLKGMDVAGFAQTGTGKTGVFLLTVGHLILESSKQDRKARGGRPFAVILAPTRELAIQIQEECDKLLGHLGIDSLAIFGGASWETQAKKLNFRSFLLIRWYFPIQVAFTLPSS